MDIYGELMSKIEAYDWVSFDIFDTLLLRPYVKPTDLFRHMERNECKPGFFDARILAEKKARTSERPEPLLNQIYEEMPPRFLDMENVELLYEKCVLRKNPGMMHVYREAIDKGKHVILISDMYLPSKFLSSVLDKNGFSEHEALYVSCEYGISKHSGKLFSKALGDLKISPKEIIHLGDNKRSDVESPKRLGIDSAYYERPIDRYLRENPRERKYYRRDKGLDASIIVSMDMLKRLSSDEKGNYWYNLGYRYGGPVNYAFAGFIEDNTEDGKLLFIARDGYKPKLVYDRLFGTKKTAYVYAPRTQSILSNTNGKDYPGFEKDIEGRFPGVGPYYENRDAYENLMNDEMLAYRKYVCDIVGNNKAYVVDATTRKFTAQRLISAALGQDTEGIYYIMLRSRGEALGYHAFRNHVRMLVSLTPVDLPEFLMASSEASVQYIENGRPNYSKTVSKEDERRMEVSPKVEEGVLDFADDFLKAFGDLIPRIGPEAVTRWLRVFEKNQSSEDRENIGSLKWSSDPRHSKYHDMIFSPRDAPSFLLAKVKGLYESYLARIR